MGAVKKLMPRLIKDRDVDFVIANGENVAGGVGITPELADDLFKLGAQVLTTGNHVWRHREIRKYIDREPRLLRPANFPSRQPGRGAGIFDCRSGARVGVINLIGQVYMSPADNPFIAADDALEEVAEADVIVVDIHAEATSEKRAMGFHMDGRVTAVVGTHTHVQTADEQILEGGTAYITDMGMSGPHDSVIGMRKDGVLARFRTGLPQSFKPAGEGARLQGVLIDADLRSGHALSIERIDLSLAG
ncbi:MAG: YmdB family metallophosphoesterase [Deltaproteobacteria bacterium]|nr:YmdB family metallophosphoesterase [Deltaproteobacteria bacterium]